MRHAVSFAATFALAICLATASASAQRYDGEGFSNEEDMQTGTRFTRAPETAGQTEARRLQRRVARCVYDRHDDTVDKILAHSTFDRIDFSALDMDSRKLFEELNVPTCIGRAMKGNTYSMRMSIPFDTLRNLLTEEAYLDAVSEPLAIPAGAPVKLTNRYRYETMGPRAATIADLGDCIVHADAANADAMLRARPGSKDEAQAIEDLSPALSNCMGTESSPEVDASMLRKVMADGLWSRTHYGPSAPAAKAEARPDGDSDTQASDL